MNRIERKALVVALLEQKLLGKGPGTRKLKAQFSKARRSITPGAGRAGGAAFGLQGRLKRAETYLAARAKKQPKAVAARDKRNAKRVAADAQNREMTQRRRAVKLAEINRLNAGSLLSQGVGFR